jgi:cell division protein ZapB
VRFPALTVNWRQLLPPFIDIFGMSLKYMNFLSLTCLSMSTIVSAIHNAYKTVPMPESQFNTLEQKIDDLISLCADLNRENVVLKADASGWHQERQQLVQRNELARTKVEAMISRLKVMEQGA